MTGFVDTILITITRTQTEVSFVFFLITGCGFDDMIDRQNVGVDAHTVLFGHTVSRLHVIIAFWGEVCIGAGYRR